MLECDCDITQSIPLSQSERITGKYEANHERKICVFLNQSYDKDLDESVKAWHLSTCSFK